MELLVEKTYTAEEYFELEKKSDTKHEFHFGKLTEMPGESKRDNDGIKFWPFPYSCLTFLQKTPKRFNILGGFITSN